MSSPSSKSSVLDVNRYFATRINPTIYVVALIKCFRADTRYKMPKYKMKDCFWPFSISINGDEHRRLLSTYFHIFAGLADDHVIMLHVADVT